VQRTDRPCSATGRGFLEGTSPNEGLRGQKTTTGKECYPGPARADERQPSCTQRSAGVTGCSDLREDPACGSIGPLDRPYGPEDPRVGPKDRPVGPKDRRVGLKDRRNRRRGAIRRASQRGAAR
jgi:hypothetical protein